MAKNTEATVIAAVMRMTYASRFYSQDAPRHTARALSK
jgi:hypothetical protein